MTQSALADAYTIYHSAVEPDSESDADVDAAMERADNAARNAASTEGYTYTQSVSNDIAQHDAAQHEVTPGRPPALRPRGLADRAPCGRRRCRSCIDACLARDAHRDAPSRKRRALSGAVRSTPR